MTSLIRIDETGAFAASLAEVNANFFARYKALIGEDLSESPQTPQAQIAGVTGAITAEVLEAIVELFNGNSIDHAGGILLTDLGSILAIMRILATHSRATATLTGVAGTGVPAGSRVRTAEGDLFETLADAALSPSGVQVEMLAVEEGPVPAAAGALSEIVTVIPGWETVTNAEAAILGIAEQSDQSYKMAYRSRTGRVSTGANPALEAAIVEARGGRPRLVENRTGATKIEQEWSVYGHSILAIVEGGLEGDIRRAIETHRGQGVGTMTAILGGAADASALDAISNGTVSWNGTDYAGLDLSSAATAAMKAAALTALLDGTGVTVSHIGGAYVAIYAWEPDETPAFGGGSVEQAFGLDPDAATASPGPFVRPRTRELAVTAAVTRRGGFPGNGLARLRTVLTAVADGYEIGEQVWLNDFLAAAEGIPGTRVTSLTVQYDGSDISGVDVPLDVLWSLPASGLTINIS